MSDEQPSSPVPTPAAALEHWAVGVARHLAWPLAAVLGVLILAVAVVAWPAKHPTAPPGIAVTPAPVPAYAQTTNDLKSALTALAAMRGAAPAYEQPAISVIEKALPSSGLTSAQLGQLLAALQPPRQTVVHAATVVVPPTPQPIYTAPPDVARLSPLTTEGAYAIARRADVDALGDTAIKTTVDVTQEERPPSRVGSIISSTGAGISYAVVRRGKWDLDLAAVIGAYDHITPTLGVIYRVPHTSLGVGPTVGVGANGSVRAGVGAVITF